MECWVCFLGPVTSMLGTCGSSEDIGWDLVVILGIIETRECADCFVRLKVPWRESVGRSVTVCRAFLTSYICLFLVLRLHENVLLDDSVMSPGHAGWRRAVRWRTQALDCFFKRIEPLMILVAVSLCMYLHVCRDTYCDFMSRSMLSHVKPSAP